MLVQTLPSLRTINAMFCIVQGPAPVWVSEDQEVANTNLVRFMTGFQVQKQSSSLVPARVHKHM